MEIPQEPTNGPVKLGDLLRSHIKEILMTGIDPIIAFTPEEAIQMYDKMEAIQKDLNQAYERLTEIMNPT